MMAKIRWEQKRLVQSTQDQLSGDMRKECEKVLEAQPLDPTTGTIDLSKLRPTDLSTVRDVVVPDLETKEEEQRLQDLKSDLLNTTKRYTKEKYDSKAEPLQNPIPKDILQEVEDLREIVLAPFCLFVFLSPLSYSLGSYLLPQQFWYQSDNFSILPHILP